MTDVGTTCTWPQRAPQLAVLFSHIRGSKASSLDDSCGWAAAAAAPVKCALIFKTKDWQQGGEDRGISEGQQAGCCQVTTFKALENLLFPGSAPLVCFLAVCASVNELRGCVCVYVKNHYVTIQTLRQTDVLLPLQKSDTKPSSLHRFSKTL